ncbi:glycerophosphodiester phosphodiesterase [Dokdonella sp.]|uniref:glycerophosphodiester phosphodiesterase n=1 Tax=Dokdonella sp. TaxID=2291710 RepID=UPI001B0D1185|nr:glycerophosphodiester phosphodiesterase [Dokdonella sp.]MBO9661833.1 glycerophosphodiester phosphodiesterase [Dokdonella sp.]
MRSILLAIGFAAVSSLTAHAAEGDDALNSRPITNAPLVIGHRGASGYRPEHTLASYELAIDLGADFVEPDLVSTRDGVLVARHENEIGGTTDVADHSEFAARRTTKTIDGNAVTGWFTEDFTLVELKTLRARERLPELRQRNTLYDDRYEIPTLDEVIALVKSKQHSLHRTIGLYPETKHPTYFRSIGLALETPLVRTLHRAGYRNARAPVFIQSFEVGNLRDLSRMTRLPLVQLIDAAGQPYDFTASGDPRTYADLVTPAGLREIGQYASGVGVAKNLIVPRAADGTLLAPTTLIDDAHAAGLVVHAWTFRNENSFLPLDFRVGDAASPVYPSLYGKAFDEYALFFGLGLDGAFSDNPDTAIAARAAIAR